MANNSDGPLIRWLGVQNGEAGKKVFFCAHDGSSMYPTLTGQDILEIDPAGTVNPKKGDVIMFEQPGEDSIIVHRVISVTPGGIITRGDNAGGVDPWIVDPREIKGRVIAAWRGAKRRIIRGGQRGRLAVYAFRLAGFFLKPLFDILQLSVSRLSGGGMLSFLLPAGMNPRILLFRSERTVTMRLLMGKRQVGIYDDRTGKWIIGKAARFFIDDAVLQEAAKALRD